MPLDPDVAALLASMQAVLAIEPSSVGHERFRAGFAAMPRPTDAPSMDRVEDRVAPGPAGDIPLRVFHPTSRATHPGLVFFHGGGFVVGGLDTHDHTCRELAAGAQCCVVAVDYRLAPEAKFPAAPADAFAATGWVARNADVLGIDARRLAVAGDSAGGNLAAVVALLARDRGGPDLVHQLLIYPVIQPGLDTASAHRNATGYFLTRATMEWFWQLYLEDPEHRADPRAAPLRAADLAELPPATVLTAEFDPLRDEGRAYAEALAGAGVATRHLDYPGVIHGFFGMTGTIARARTAIDDACAALRQSFDGTG